MYISYSRIQSYLSCPYSHWLRYVRRLEKKKPERPLYFGTDFHKLLEVRKDPKAVADAKAEMTDNFYAMPASWQSDLGENYIEDLSSIFADYQFLYQDCRLPTVTEKEFQLEVGNCGGEPIVFVGKIDELYLLKRKGKKTITIGEHKTFSSRPNMDTLVMNPQKCLYAKAVFLLKGILPEKVKWDYIRSTPAAYPVWLEKSNRFSSASSSNITPMSYRRACQQRGITDPKELANAERYADNIANFFFQLELDIDPHMVDKIWEDYIYTAKQIIKRGQKNTTHNVTRNCAWCTYHDICFAEMTGGDPEYVVSKDFQERKKE